MLGGKPKKEWGNNGVLRCWISKWGWALWVIYIIYISSTEYITSSKISMRKAL